jgi:uncharacterized protein
MSCVMSMIPVYAALLGLMPIDLSVNVIKGRRKFGAGLGDADNIEMKRRIRAQANLAEYAPMYLILSYLVLLGYAEQNGLPLWAVHILGSFWLDASCMLKAEQYDQHKRTANPIWRIRGKICTLNLCP